MLNVALFELMTGALEYMLAHERGVAIQKSQTVLQLVAKSVCAAHLVKTRPRFHSRVVNLIGQPFCKISELAVESDFCESAVKQFDFFELFLRVAHIGAFFGRKRKFHCFALSRSEF